MQSFKNKQKEDNFILNAGNSSQAKYLNFPLNSYLCTYNSKNCKTLTFLKAHVRLDQWT